MTMTIQGAVDTVLKAVPGAALNRLSTRSSRVILTGPVEPTGISWCGVESQFACDLASLRRPYVPVLSTWSKSVDPLCPPSRGRVIRRHCTLVNARPCRYTAVCECSVAIGANWFRLMARVSRREHGRVSSAGTSVQLSSPCCARIGNNVHHYDVCSSERCINRKGQMGHQAETDSRAPHRQRWLCIG